MTVRLSFVRYNIFETYCKIFIVINVSISVLLCSKIFQFQELLCLVWHGLSNNNSFFFPDRFSYLRITSTTKHKWTAHQSVWCPQAVWGSYLMDLLTGSMKVKPISMNNKKPRGLCACNKRAEVIVNVWCV